MASALTNLVAEYTTQIATISDDLTRLEATYKLEVWAAAVAKLTALQSGVIQTYSIAGRSFTRYNIGDFEATVKSLQADLYRYIYGSISLLDMNTVTGEPTSS